jgi:A/G-specific adenine glycosylase
VQADLPRKAARPPKPVRHGTVWVARRGDGAWLLERRPGKGLLGGMLGWPGDGWDGGGGAAPLAADWQDAGEVRHVFTHFDLRLSVAAAHAAQGAEPLRGDFLTPAGFGPGDLPTVMRKAFDRARAQLVPA